uniref:Uncharacterized protein n=1 Tax=Glossina brevipalpis TaxID=37001 RepID=A0A1A9W7A2_9MUSC
MACDTQYNDDDDDDDDDAAAAISAAAAIEFLFICIVLCNHCVVRKINILIVTREVPHYDENNRFKCNSIRDSKRSFIAASYRMKLYFYGISSANKPKNHGGSDSFDEESAGSRLNKPLLATYAHVILNDQGTQSYKAAYLKPRKYMQ